MGKLIGQAGEAAKVKVRHARKIAVDGIKSMPSEDDQKRAEKQASKLPRQLCLHQSVLQSLEHYAHLNARTLHLSIRTMPKATEPATNKCMESQLACLFCLQANSAAKHHVNSAGTKPNKSVCFKH